MGLGFSEILLIAVFVLLVFGAKRIPELAKALGRASYEYKKAKSELEAESASLIKTAEKAAEADDKTDKAGETADTNA